MDFASLLLAPPAEGRPLWLLAESEVEPWLHGQSAECAAWVRANQFSGERYRVLALPDARGELAGALLGLGPLARADELTLWHSAPLVERLAPAPYALATPLGARAATQFLLGWLIGSYRMTRYRASPAAARARLLVPAGADRDYALAAASAAALARDLVNTPANDLGPAELADAAAVLAHAHGARCEIIVGDELVRRGYPLIHAVGAGSSRAPRLIDLRWGDEAAPRVTLVGKGVCFDSGGLDLKPSAAMQLMKKDMGGAACALGLAQMLMSLGAPLRLRLLIPAVENSVGGSAYRPGDVLRSRKGLTVEIGNTDAEGRLVLADALAEADGENPQLLIDIATLTGAARTALGPELPAVFSPNEALLGELRAHAGLECDPLWPLPLWMGYDDEIGSRIADLNNIASTPFAGSIIAALFLKRFVTATPNWLHLDIFSWNPKERPGRPVGAEAQCMRALYRLIRSRCG
ncbi:MAG TPA: leucyl aminopeptidase family protein [Steroidobacteraceae bacterium]